MSDDLIGQSIAHYRITAKLGKGVWEKCIGPATPG